MACHDFYHGLLEAGWILRRFQQPNTELHGEWGELRRGGCKLLAGRELGNLEGL